MNNEYIYLWADKKDQIQDWENNQYIVLKYVLGWWIKKVKRNVGYVSNIKMVIFSLLICTLRTAFEDGRKVVLVEDPEEKLSLYYKLNFSHGGEPEQNPSRTTCLTPSKLLLRVQIKRLFGFHD